MKISYEKLKKSRLCHPVDHRVNIKVSKKRDKYLDIARKLRKLWNMKVMVIKKKKHQLLWCEKLK